jgi:hypothetical protein
MSPPLTLAGFSAPPRSLYLLHLSRCDLPIISNVSVGGSSVRLFFVPRMTGAFPALGLSRFSCSSNSWFSLKKNKSIMRQIENVHKSTRNRVSLLSVSFGPQVGTFICLPYRIVFFISSIRRGPSLLTLQIALSFLHRMTPSWRSKHVAWFIAESPAWSGTPL